jgi:nucleoside-diphosphate-sugar epimerase
MPDPLPEVAVLGATGFVGLPLCDRLRAAGYPVTAIARRSSAFLLEGRGLQIISPEEADRRPFPIVINLAYPTGPHAHLHPQENRRILDLVCRLVRPETRFVHFSSLGVFGLDLRHPVKPGLPPRGRDREYVECKAQMEHWLADRFGDQELHFVRPGNVWGPGSPNWVAGIVERLKNGQAMGVQGQTAYANLTDVANLVDYVAFLLQQPPARGLQFHHVAEFSAHTWDEVLAFLAAAVKRQPVWLREFELAPASSAQLLAVGTQACRRSALQTFRQLRSGRETGSWVRSAFATVPKPILSAVKRLKGGARLPSDDPALGPVDEQWLEVLTCSREFHSHTLPGWHPPVSHEESLARVVTWMRAAGFC